MKNARVRTTRMRPRMRPFLKLLSNTHTPRVFLSVLSNDPFLHYVYTTHNTYTHTHLPSCTHDTHDTPKGEERVTLSQHEYTSGSSPTKCWQVLSLLLYWYKSTNTDAAGGGGSWMPSTSLTSLRATSSTIMVCAVCVWVCGCVGVVVGGWSSSLIQGW